MVERILRGIDGHRQDERNQPRDEADRHRRHQGDDVWRRMARDCEQRIGTEGQSRMAGKQAPEQGGHGACDHDRHQAARLPLEEQELDGEEDRGDRRAESGRHASGGAGDEQRLSFGGRHVEHLGDDGAEGAAGHDDRPFRAERTAGADRDGRRQRLEDRDLRLHPALADQNGLNGFGDAVPANALRAVTGHETDDQACRRRGRQHHHRRSPPSRWRSSGGDRSSSGILAKVAEGSRGW